MNRQSRTVFTSVLLGVAIMAAASEPVRAQGTPVAQTQRDFRAGMRTGIGYTGVMPDAIFGAGVFHLFGDRPVGLFADFRTTSFSGIRKDETYCPSAISDCTNSWVLSHRNDQHVNEEQEWLAFNLGFLYAATPEFAFMVGGGMARETRFQEFFDDNADTDERVTLNGSYYVDDELTPAWKAQAVGAFLLRASRKVVFRVGYETAISGLAFGAYFVLP